MKKKVISGKRAGLNILVSAMILVELFLAGCGKGNSNANTNAAPATTTEAPAETPTPTVTPTPEAEIDPEIDKQEEEKRIEDVAKAYYERLSANPGYPNSYEKVLEFSKRYNGNFESLPNMQGLDKDARQAIELQYYNEMVNFMIDYINTMINNAIAEVFEGKKSESPNPETDLIFRNDKSGVDTINLIENLGIEVRKSISDPEAFKQKATEFQNLIATLYLESGNLYNGVRITSVNEMDKDIETAARIEAQGFIAIIQMASVIYKQEIFTTIPGVDECYTTDDIINILAGSLDCNVDSWALDATTKMLLQMEIYQGFRSKELEYTPVP